jgi:hypothetical protein
VEVTPASGVTSDGSSDPSLRLRLLRELRVVAPTATGIVAVSVSVRVSSSSRDALLLKRGGRVLLLLLLATTLLLLVQVTMQSLQVAGLTWHRVTQWTLHRARRQKGDHRLTCSAPKTSHLQKDIIRQE